MKEKDKNQTINVTGFVQLAPIGKRIHVRLPRYIIRKGKKAFRSLSQILIHQHERGNEEQSTRFAFP